MTKGAQIAIGGAIVFALLGWYGYQNLQGSGFQYYQTLAEFQTASIPAGTSLRVHGYVAEGSIERRLDDKQVHFRVQNDPPHAGGAAGVTLAVVYHGLETPDLFKDGAEVVVEGTLSGQVFLAENVMAKCPSKFEAELEQAAETPTAEL